MVIQILSLALYRETIRIVPILFHHYYKSKYTIDPQKGKVEIKTRNINHLTLLNRLFM